MYRTAWWFLSAVLLSAPALAGDDKQLYDNNCRLCHRMAGSGGAMAKMGGSLDGIGSRREEKWLREYLENPKAKNPHAKMPALKLREEERNRIIRYLMSPK